MNDAEFFRINSRRSIIGSRLRKKYHSGERKFGLVDFEVLKFDKNNA